MIVLTPEEFQELKDIKNRAIEQAAASAVIPLLAELRLIKSDYTTVAVNYDRLKTELADLKSWTPVHYGIGAVIGTALGIFGTYSILSWIGALK